MGSPEFAVPCLRALAIHHEVVLVVSQPDKPAGRGGHVKPPAVKIAAAECGLPVIQPASARNGELEQALAQSGAELGVVVAYGKILPRSVLQVLPRGCINVHASLLPKYRGAAPVQWAVIAGERETGISMMQLDEGLDTGPVLLQRVVAIDEMATAGEVATVLAPIGADAALEAIARLSDGTARFSPQDDSQATHARILTKADGVIDFSQPASAVAARIRGVDPWPGAQAHLAGTASSHVQLVKLFRAASVELGGDARPGTIVDISNQGARIACCPGAVTIREIQVAGRKRMSAQQLAAGRGIKVGDTLIPSSALGASP